MEAGVEIVGFQFYKLEQPEDDCHTDTIIRALCDYFGPSIQDMTAEQLIFFAKENIRVIRDYGLYEERLEIKSFYDDSLTQFEIQTAVEMIVERSIY